MNRRICDYCSESWPLNKIKLTRRPNDEDICAELCDDCLIDISQTATQEIEERIRFETMALVLLSTSEARLIITKSALKESLNDYQIVAKPDSRLTDVEYILRRKNQYLDLEEQKQ